MIEIDKFVSRHIGPRNEDIGEMLKLINCSSLDELIEKTVPNHIIFKDKLKFMKIKFKIMDILEKR